ncbi:MAG: hypothetical protein BGO49_25290 [Planctomycetales bacterium 71-10]|nr:MAG: hypothetical protein BGO49_25290 [Planctomycetales bacterium 71-10]
MSKSILHSALAKIAAELESRLEVAVEYIGHADRVVVSAALGTLTGAVNDALDAIQALARNPEAVADAVAADRMDVLRDALYAALSPIAGGAPDDHETIDPEGWPSEYSPELDDYTWEPTPDHILAAERDAHTDCVDWDAYSLLDVAGISEADHLVAHGCC